MCCQKLNPEQSHAVQVLVPEFIFSLLILAVCFLTLKREWKNEPGPSNGNVLSIKVVKQRKLWKRFSSLLGTWWCIPTVTFVPESFQEARAVAGASELNIGH